MNFHYVISLGYISIFVLAALLSCLGTWGIRNFAMQRSWISAPTSPRHIHKRPVPRLGGIAVFASFALVMFAAYLIGRITGMQSLNSRKILLLLTPAVPVFLLGIYDDFKGVRPWMKFSGQVMGAGFLFIFGFRVSTLDLLFGPQVFSTAVSFFLTVFWVVLVTNAFNLIDGLDGLAAGSALFSTLVISFVALFLNAPTVSFMALALAGAILGFLKFNFNPATIFLGDCGSLFLGFMLAGLSLAGSYKAPTLVAIAIPLVAFGLPITDTALAVVRRFLSGKPLFSADREHIHHKLLERGLSHKQTAIILYGVSAAFGLASIFLLYPHGTIIAVVLVIVSILVMAGISKLGYLEFAEVERLALRTLEQREIIKNNLLLRRAMRHLQGCSTLDSIVAVLEEAIGKNDLDGFRLQVTREGTSSEHKRGSRENFCHEFWKPASSWSDANVWELRLPVGTRKHHVGELTVFRKYSGGTLLLDLNLLTLDFPNALCGAVIRATESGVPEWQVTQVDPKLGFAEPILAATLHR